MARTLDLAKRTAILAAAKAIFTKDGYDVAKMSDIAAEAGVAPGTLYLYFENKEALASAIGEDFFARMRARFGEIVHAIEGPGGIVALVDLALQLADEDLAAVKMIKERNKRLTSTHEDRQHFIAELGEAFSDLMSRGVIRRYPDASILANLVLAVLRRVIMSHAVYEDENTVELKAGAVTMLQHALFDDVTLAAHRLVMRNQTNKQ